MSGTTSLNDPMLKDEFLSLLKATSTTEQRQKWADSNKSFRCNECVTHRQDKCTPNTDISIRCAFCQYKKSYCTRVDAERRATIKELLDLNDRQFDTLKSTLEKEGLYNRGLGYLPRKERQGPRLLNGPVSGSTTGAAYVGASEEYIRICVPPRFEEIMKQAQLDCQRQMESSNTSVTGLSLQLKQKFAMEMSKRGSRWHYLAWNNANPDFVCSACKLEGLECSIADSGNLICIPCRRRKTGCSRKLAEARWRTMKVLELDDQTFDTLLAQATIIVRGVNEQDENPSGADARPTAQKRKRLSHTNNSAGHRDPQPGVRVSSRPIKRTEKSVSNPQPPSRSTASTLVTRARPTASSVSVVMPRLPGRPPIDPDKKIKRLQEQLALVNAHNTELRKELRALNHRPTRASVDEELQAKYDEAVQDLAEVREELIEATQKNYRMTKEHETEKAALVQQQIAEHANISILRTRLRQLTDLFEEGKYSRDDMVGTCRNLCGQLQEVADRHLTQIPLGFSNILGAMTFADSGHEEEPPARRRRI